MRRLLTFVALLGLAALAWTFRVELQRHIPALVFAVSPHTRYEAWLRLRQLDRTPTGSAWLAAADRAVREPLPAAAPFVRAGTFDTGSGAAAAWLFPVRRGQRVSVVATATVGRLFVDVFRARNDTLLASAPGGDAQVVYDATADEELIVRVQPELQQVGAYRVVQQSRASMTFPIHGLGGRAVQSGFGSARDAGRRQHQGVDIFAPRGTPVVAATDGWIGNSRSNRLGGNVVWVWSPLRGVSTYYAHLDRQAVMPGERVNAGDLVGWVGNTGNARTTPPHLHFGVYLGAGGAVDPLPFICDGNCGGRINLRVPAAGTSTKNGHAATERTERSLHESRSSGG